MTDETLSILREQVRKFINRDSRKNSNARFDTSDVIQDVVLQSWLRHQKDGLEESESTDERARAREMSWLKSAARGHLAKTYRFHFADKRSIRREKLDATQMEESVSPRSSPLQIAEKNELIKNVLLQIRELPSLQKAIVQKRFFEQMTLRDIARDLDVTVHCVTSELGDALRILGAADGA